METVVVRGKTTWGESSVGGRAEEANRKEAHDRADADHGTRVHRGYAEVRAVVRAFTRRDRWMDIHATVEWAANEPYGLRNKWSRSGRA